jgi:hypothetical protein
MAIFYKNHLSPLKEAFSKGNLTFYLGAGVSKDNGLPSWEELVQALYFSTLEDESYIYQLKPFPNYLFAIAEWVLKQKNEPLDIIIRKIKQWYEGKDFMGMLCNTLYASFERENSLIDIPGISCLILSQNKTLSAIVECCRKSKPAESGVHAIVTYNYDNFLELGLEKYADIKDNFITIYKGEQLLLYEKIPIYHVHGYIPYQNNDIKFEDILFSEEQYNRAFQDPFYWGNVVQINQLTSVTGLMLGLSLSDRNTRRILDSIRSQPVLKNNYILMRKPKYKNIEKDEYEINKIREKAYEYQKNYQDSRMKMPAKESYQIQQILDSIYKYETMEFEKGIENIGLNLITFDDFEEIPEILHEITNV